MIKTLKYSLIALSSLFFAAPSWADDAFATVTYLEGRVLKSADNKNWGPVYKGDRLSEGETVKTGAGARLELTLPDSSNVRFSENTSFKIETLLLTEDERGFGFSVLFGRVWSKVVKFQKTSRVEIKTPNAVAGVKGTTYRVDAYEDNSALVRVYEGEVSVGSLSSKRDGRERKARYVQGPKEVPGPHEVTREEWSYIVKSWQQITISPKGIASFPASFSAEEDLNDWVLWNQELDKK